MYAHHVKLNMSAVMVAGESWCSPRENNTDGMRETCSRCIDGGQWAMSLGWGRCMQPEANFHVILRS